MILINWSCTGWFFILWIKERVNHLNSSCSSDTNRATHGCLNCLYKHKDAQIHEEEEKQGVIYNLRLRNNGEEQQWELALFPGGGAPAAFSRLDFSPLSERVSFRSQAIGWLLITERCIKSSPVNNVITAVQGSASPAGTARRHLSPFLFLSSLSLSLHLSFLQQWLEFSLHMLCNYSSPVAPGEERGLIPEKQKPLIHSLSSPLPPPRLSSGRPQHPLKGFIETQNQQLHRRRNRVVNKHSSCLCRHMRGGKKHLRKQLHEWWSFILHEAELWNLIPQDVFTVFF